MLILPEMHGTDLTFKTGRMDNCDCVETLNPTADGNLDAGLLITHAYMLAKIDEAFEN